MKKLSRVDLSIGGFFLSSVFFFLCLKDIMVKLFHFSMSLCVSSLKKKIIHL